MPSWRRTRRLWRTISHLSVVAWLWSIGGGAVTALFSYLVGAVFDLDAPALALLVIAAALIGTAITASALRAVWGDPANQATAVPTARATTARRQPLTTGRFDEVREASPPSPADSNAALDLAIRALTGLIEEGVMLQGRASSAPNAGVPTGPLAEQIADWIRRGDDAVPDDLAKFFTPTVGDPPWHARGIENRVAALTSLRTVLRERVAANTAGRLAPPTSRESARTPREEAMIDQAADPPILMGYMWPSNAERSGEMIALSVRRPEADRGRLVRCVVDFDTGGQVERRLSASMARPEVAFLGFGIDADSYEIEFPGRFPGGDVMLPIPRGQVASIRWCKSRRA